MGECSSKGTYKRPQDADLANRSARDYALSRDFANMLTMWARGERGYQARRYFLKCERGVHHDAAQRCRPHVHAARFTAGTSRAHAIYEPGKLL